MKRMLALLLCLLAICPAHASGLFDVPALPEGIDLTLGEGHVFLEFDSDPEYTSISGGMVQVSFYAYTEDESALYELYLTFPEDVQPGDVVNPQYAVAAGASDCSVALIYSTQEDENYYLAGQLDIAPYPEGSDYSIAFADIVSQDGGTRYAGTLDATLVMLDLSSGLFGQSLEIVNAPFSFTLPHDPALPRSTVKPTLPPDMYRV